jgi:hypothetical protein
MAAALFLAFLRFFRFLTLLLNPGDMSPRFILIEHLFSDLIVGVLLGYPKWKEK